jgi:hypothetical protein
MPHFDVDASVRLHFEGAGVGRPELFLPNWTMSTAIFRR